LVSEAIAKILPQDKLRYIAFSHFEADECGSLNDFLAAAPKGGPVCSQVAALVSVIDVADRPAQPLADGEVLKLGRHEVRWYDTPHLPHAWECGLMMELHTSTFFCGDLFTQGGKGEAPLTEADILGPSEAFRSQMDYFAHSPDTTAMLERLAGERPKMLACMHGSAWRGDGAELLRNLAQSLSRPRLVA
jgi:flavorubredoxin